MAMLGNTFSDFMGAVLRAADYMKILKIVEPGSKITINGLKSNT